ncbi:hypothetical protein HMPREF1141_1934 [Clostridium sp. MSTE9]|nr:hypothetical protein HMPREF1141_1934 [Clostridium sp. MSTE9]
MGFSAPAIKRGLLLFAPETSTMKRNLIAALLHLKHSIFSACAKNKLFGKLILPFL